jgi:hypothetical protein
MAIAKRPDFTPENRENHLRALKAEVEIRKVEAALPALERMIKQGEGTLEVEDIVLGKDGEQIKIMRKPNQRVMLDANKAIVVEGSDLKTQKVLHGGMIGYELIELSPTQLKKLILEEGNKNAIEVEAEDVTNNDN